LGVSTACAGNRSGRRIGRAGTTPRTRGRNTKHRSDHAQFFEPSGISVGI